MACSDYCGKINGNEGPVCEKCLTGDKGPVGNHRAIGAKKNLMVLVGKKDHAMAEIQESKEPILENKTQLVILDQLEKLQENWDHWF